MSEKPKKPFDDAPQEKTAPKIELKAPKTKSMFDDAPKKPSKEAFEKKASEINQQLNSYAERGAELVNSFQKILADKTLPQNKSVLASDLEREIIGKMSVLAQEMCNDEYEQEAVGAVAMITYLFRIALLQRDRLNKLEYGFGQLESKIKELGLDKKTQDK